MSTFIELNNFQVKIKDKYFLSPLTFTSCKSEFVVLVAPSGSGKTKLFESLILDSKNIDGTVKINYEIATVPQSLDLVKQETSLHNVAIAGLSNYSSLRTLFSIPTALTEKAKYYLNALDFFEHDKYIYQLSGGEQQRVAMARIMMSHSKIWLLDEPVSQLDDNSALKCLSVLKNHALKNNILILCILHQKQLSKSISDRQISWLDGQWEFS